MAPNSPEPEVPDAGAPTLAPAWSFDRATPDPIVDEPINRWLHRRLAYALLVMCRPIAGLLSPNLLTIIGTLLGVASGAALIAGVQPEYLHHRTDLSLIAAACLLVSVIFDCSDGMFARLTGKSSQLGMILDGASDTIVYTSVWVGLTMHLDAATSNPWIWPIAIVTALISFTQI
ncbi:MAG: CDP-alcohol phosphatidyltransferase family protein, partial [Nannocystaceae bacterium]